MDKENNNRLLKAYLGFKEETTFEQLVKQAILKAFNDIKLLAEKNQVCRRKAVGCAILEIDLEHELIMHTMAINGPSGPNNECSNIVGACGCSHSEPRAIMKFLKRSKRNGQRGKTILLSTFSACVNCSNIIIDSNIIDAVAYEILAPHWAIKPNNAKAMLDRTLPHWSKQQIEEDLDNGLIRNWLHK